MVGNRDEPPAFGMQEMNMAAGLPYRFKTKMVRILIISRDDSRGIFDKIIHFNVQVGQLMVPGCQFD